MSPRHSARPRRVTRSGASTGSDFAGADDETDDDDDDDDDDVGQANDGGGGGGGDEGNGAGGDEGVIADAASTGRCREQ
jgi:hypothetical protein